MYLPLIVSPTPLKMTLQDYEEYYLFGKMIEKVFVFHHNRIVDNMVDAEVTHRTADNMNYNVEVVEIIYHIAAEATHTIADNMDYNVQVAESRAHIVVKDANKIVKVAANMAHNESQL